jgi:hypothetical protein
LEFLAPRFILPPPKLINDSIQLLHHVYGDFHDAHNRTEERLIDRTILTPKNKDVDAMKDHAVQSFPGEENVYLSADRLAQDESERCLLHGAFKLHEPARLHPHQLRPKVGIPVIPFCGKLTLSCDKC